MFREILDEYHEQAEAEGEAKGEVRARVANLLHTIDKRGLRPSPAQLEQIMSCTDPVTLDRWFDAALDAEEADELFR